MRRLACLGFVATATIAAIPAWADLPPFPHPGPRPRPPVCRVEPVRSVDRAELEPGPVPRLRASGTAATAGWSDPQLRFVTVSQVRTDRATAVYELVGCRPLYAAQVLSPVAAATDVSLYPENGRVRFVLVRAATNSIRLKLDAPGRR